jgi:hypothetical protein
MGDISEMDAPGGDPFDEMLRLKSDELDLLASITKRAYQSVLTHRPIRLKTGQAAESPQTLRVASLAFKLPDPSGFIQQMPSPGAGVLNPTQYELVVYDEGNDALPAKEIPRIVGEFLEEARQQNCAPHFVLLNELSHAFEGLSEQEDEWFRLAKEYKTYIVPGTYHSTDEFFGVAPIYGPRRKTANVLKQNPARRQGEIIRTPDSRELFTYVTDYANVVIWICLDVYDPGLVLKFLNLTNRFSGEKEERQQKKREISLVLIPAFSSDRTENIRYCIQTLSRFSKTAMICTNSFIEGKTKTERLESYGYCAGEPLVETLSREYSSVSGKASCVCRSWLYEVDLHGLRGTQATSYQKDRMFSSPFATIINGGPAVFRDVKE